MDSKLSAEAISLLIELKNNPYFHEILDSLDDGKIPLYKPVRSDETLQVNAQESNWKFYSGKLRERTRIINLLSGEKK